MWVWSDLLARRIRMRIQQRQFSIFVISMEYSFLVFNTLGHFNAITIACQLCLELKYYSLCCIKYLQITLPLLLTPRMVPILPNPSIATILLTSNPGIQLQFTKIQYQNYIYFQIPWKHNSNSPNINNKSKLGNALLEPKYSRCKRSI